MAGRYQELLAELEFVSDAYSGALMALETARIESTRKLKSLVLVESPALPESAEYPRRFYTLFALLMGLTSDIWNRATDRRNNRGSHGMKNISPFASADRG